MKLNSLHKDLGTAKDNRVSPIHDWYRFTAGFSYKLVDKIIAEEQLEPKDVIYESFAGCGTTLVSAQKNGIFAVGNEAQELLYDVIRAKLNWNINIETVISILKEIQIYSNLGKFKNEIHDLLKTLYSESDLFQLYLIRDFINDFIQDEAIKLFLKLALTQTLHRVSIHPISVPYISRSKTLSNSLSASEMFEKTVIKMLFDLEGISTSLYREGSIFMHDSRTENNKIPDNLGTICITSPPYLNNLDYGEVSKVCSHFFGITDNWNDITEKVRKKLVTGATTHYKENEFDIDAWKKDEFYLQNKRVVDRLLPDLFLIKEESKLRKGKKSFDVLAMHYFSDMYKVILEMRRVLKPGSKAYLVLGDSAPYGIYIDTIKLLGQIGKNAGFEKYKVVKIRERGTKWLSLRFRHSLTLSESILILE